MSERTTYEIVLRGHVSAGLLRPLLDDFTVDPARDGVTRLVGAIGDASHLHGVLAHLTSVNTDVISIGPLHPPATPTHDLRSAPMITVSGITKRYGTRVAVDDISFGVSAGRVTGFVGPNGAGKSTTMRMMVGLTRPDRGEVRYDSVRYTDLRHPARVVGSVLDARCMHPGRTARNHLRATAAVSGLPPGRAEEVLAAVGLETAGDQRAGGFSLGMRQRLALAGALLGDPQVLLLDEPSNGLDPDGIRWLRNYLSGFADRGGTVFVSSHLIGELSMFADDLVVVGAGKLLAAETVEAITARNEITVVVVTPQPAELMALLAANDIAASADDGRLLVHGTTTTVVSQLAFDHGIRVVELTETARSLEDSLLDMTRASAEFASA
jgi:ABC-2 type transport system ATP-binding protein